MRKERSYTRYICVCKYGIHKKNQLSKNKVFLTFHMNFAILKKKNKERRGDSMFPTCLFLNEKQKLHEVILSKTDISILQEIFWNAVNGKEELNLESWKEVIVNRPEYILQFTQKVKELPKSILLNHICLFPNTELKVQDLDLPDWLLIWNAQDETIRRMMEKIMILVHISQLQDRKRLYLNDPIMQDFLKDLKLSLIDKFTTEEIEEIEEVEDIEQSFFDKPETKEYLEQAQDKNGIYVTTTSKADDMISYMKTNDIRLERLELKTNKIGTYSKNPYLYLQIIKNANCLRSGIRGLQS